MARTLITGCSSGIGRATAMELARRGHEVVATARRLESLEDLDVAERLALDVDVDSSVERAVAAAGDVEILVNNAGWEAAGPVECTPLDAARAMFETNVFGAARMIQAVVPGMRARGSGTVVNVSSVAGRVAGPLNGFYSASKHALEALSESLHYEVGHFGIRVLIVEPGAIETAFDTNSSRFGEAGPPYDELRRQWDEASQVLAGDQAVPGPELVAGIIADAVEADDPPLRLLAGSDAELVMAVRKEHDDAAFEAVMRETLGLDW